MAKKARGARSQMQRQAAAGVPVAQPGARQQRKAMARGRAATISRGPLASSDDMMKAAGHGLFADARNVARSVGEGARGVASRTQKTAVQVAGKVRDNRWPALLIGAGATWLAVDAVRGRGESGGRASESRRQISMPRERGMASDAASSIKDAGRELGGRVGQFVRDNPVLAGATTLGVGLAVGMALPASRVEKAVIGDAREKVVRKAKDAAREKMRDVKDVAESVGRLAGRG